MKPGEKIRVCTRNGQNYFCSISDITESFVRADILEKEAESTELPCRIYLFQGLPKNDKMEWIIQKTVELAFLSSNFTTQFLNCLFHVILFEINDS